MNAITYLLVALGIAFGWLYVLWIYYLAVMCLAYADGKARLAGMTRAFAYCVLGPGYLLDFLTNALLASVLFMELPTEWLLTARLTRHLNESNGWRRELAQWFCATLLDRFDPSGCHCKKSKLETGDRS